MLKSKKILFGFQFLFLVSIQLIGQTGANIDESLATTMLYVDCNSVSITEDGTIQNPYKTISGAISVAITRKSTNIGTKIIVNDGVYREKLDFGSSTNKTAPIILEAKNTGNVTVKGSEILTGFTSVGNYFKTYWGYKWGKTANPWPNYVTLTELSSRKEMLFVNGKRYEQVLTESELTKGTFCVDISNNMFIYPADGDNLSISTVEASTKSIGLLIGPYNTGYADTRTNNNIVIRGLNFNHFSNYLLNAVNCVLQSSNVLIENCKFDENSFGLDIHYSDAITIRNCTANSNSFAGFEGGYFKNAIVTNCTTNNNNWRGNPSDFTDWATGGIKFLLTDNVLVEKHTSKNNYCPGIWFDFDNTNIKIKDCVSNYNQATAYSGQKNSCVSGIYIEASRGPFLVSNCDLIGNRNGVYIASSNDVSIDNCRIEGNTKHQVMVYGDSNSGRSSTNWITGIAFTSHPRNTSITNCTIKGLENSGNLLFGYNWGDTSGYNEWIRYLGTVDFNKYTYQTLSNCFMDKSLNIINFDNWKTSTQKDANSTFNAPNALKNTDQNDLSVFVDRQSKTLQLITDMSYDLVKLYNLKGQCVFLGTSLDKNQRIDISPLSVGLYFLYVKSGNSLQRVKVLL